MTRKLSGPGPRLLLASASPRRRELLAHLGLPFDVLAPDVDEGAPEEPGLRPEEWAVALAQRKARAVASQAASRITVAADTIVVQRAVILGKPKDLDHARQMLYRLRAGEHDVITGVAVLDSASVREACAHAATRVRMRDYAEEETEVFLQEGNPLDKAGAYAIQDPAFHPTASWDGCYCNVVGLPLVTVLRLLQELGHGAKPQLPPQCQGCPELPKLLPR